MKNRELPIDLLKKTKTIFLFGLPAIFILNFIFEHVHTYTHTHTQIFTRIIRIYTRYVHMAFDGVGLVEGSIPLKIHVWKIAALGCCGDIITANRRCDNLSGFWTRPGFLQFRRVRVAYVPDARSIYNNILFGFILYTARVLDLLTYMTLFIGISLARIIAHISSLWKRSEPWLWSKPYVYKTVESLRFVLQRIFISFYDTKNRKLKILLFVNNLRKYFLRHDLVRFYCYFPNIE